jgi:hypothetical protein
MRQSRGGGRVRWAQVEEEVPWWIWGTDPRISTVTLTRNRYGGWQLQRAMTWIRSGPTVATMAACLVLRDASATGRIIFSLVPADGVGAAGLDRIMVAVLGFLPHQDEDLFDTCLHWSGCSGMLRKAPPADSARWFMPGDHWIRWDLIVLTHIFSMTVWFQRECIEALLAINVMGHVLVSWCWRRMSWELRSEDEQKVARVWVMMNWLGDP